MLYKNLKVKIGFFMQGKIIDRKVDIYLVRNKCSVQHTFLGKFWRETSIVFKIYTIWFKNDPALVTITLLVLLLP